MVELFSMTKHANLTSLQCQGDTMAEHLLAACKGKLIDQLYLLRFIGVVMYLSLNEQRVASGIVPYMHSERFYANTVGFNQGHGTEDAKRLRAFAETPFRRTAATNPGGGCLHGRMIDVDL